MTAYYVDTSALIKRYVDEVGSGWLRATLNVQPHLGGLRRDETTLGK